MSPLVLFNLFAAYPFFQYVEPNLIQKYEPNTFHPLINMFLWVISTDFVFYTIHRALHTKYLYFIHRIHHTFNYTYGMGAIYAHPIELYLGNLLPVAVPMVIFRIPYRQCDIIVFFATMFTIIISHGGYRMDLTQGHLYHHLKYKCNYGLLKMDGLLGTKYAGDTPAPEGKKVGSGDTPAPEGKNHTGDTPAPVTISEDTSGDTPAPEVRGPGSKTQQGGELTSDAETKGDQSTSSTEAPGGGAPDMSTSGRSVWL
jgi:sterol desaturase/sphingolipid hydroxylase (fatty acid hydroxylase superfamily)